MASTFSSTINSEKFSSPSPFLPHTFNTPISIKLYEDNFLICQQQVLATVKAMKLTKFLDNQDYPPKYLSTEDAFGNILNPDFAQYEQQDQLLVAWLLASMTTPLLINMVGLNCFSNME